MRRLTVPLDINDNIKITSQIFTDNVSVNTTAINTFQPSLYTRKARLIFPGYEDPLNKELIKKLADGCCAYCGRRLKDSTIIVEHYRPKKELHFRVNEIRLEGVHLEVSRRIKFESRLEKCNYGYYKFADDIHNMFPSCRACNIGEGNDPIYVAKNDSNGKSIPCNLEYKIPYGKKNFFPIYLKRNETDFRINESYINNINNEIPLLFNPYYDDPNDLFSYSKKIKNKNGFNIIKIKPRVDSTKINKLKAIVTINLLGLNRRHLCQDRFLKYAKIEKFIKNIKSMDSTDSNKCAKAIKEYLTCFDKENSEFIGYSMYLDNGAMLQLKLMLRHRFSQYTNFFGVNNDFNTVFKELKQFTEVVLTDEIEEDDDDNLTDCLIEINASIS